jgi:hypothetical protein
MRFWCEERVLHDGLDECLMRIDDIIDILGNTNSLLQHAPGAFQYLPKPSINNRNPLNEWKICGSQY